MYVHLAGKMNSMCFNYCSMGAMAARIGADRMAALLGNNFGHLCPVHHDTGHNLCIYFCLDCKGLQQEALCSHCQLLDHKSHRMLRVSDFYPFKKDYSFLFFVPTPVVTPLIFK